MLRFVIIEDEPATARHLQFSLSEIEKEAAFVTTLDSVAKSVEWFTENSDGYDIVFMDIRLSDGLSFEIFDAIKINSPVIFITAYNDYALQAFKTSGIDYILKPFEIAELQQALKKFHRLVNHKSGKENQTQLLQITHQLKTAYTSYKQSFLLHFRDKLIPVATKDIAWFYTENEISYAYTFDKRKFLVEFTLEQLQQQLNPHDFYRANRQFIVQRKAIAEVDFYFNGRLLLKLEPAAGENILISKARVPEFKAWMNR